MNRTTQDKLGSQLLFAFCLAISCIIAFFFHDKNWLGPDDGYFGYISQQMLDGKILHKDIPVLHSGYIYWINTFFFKLVDGDLVGLRYPLIAMTAFQSAIAFKLLEVRGLFTAVAAACCATAFGFVQYINPTPNWYTLFLAIILVYIIDKNDISQTKSIILIGFIVGLAFLFRQLTGAILAVGVTAAIFLHNSISNDDHQFIAGKIVILMLAIATFLYILKASKITGFVVFGILPIIVLLLTARNCVLDCRRSATIIGLLLIGAVTSAIPLILYYFMNGALLDWLKGMLISPFFFIEQPIFKKPNIFTVPGYGLKALLSGNLNAIGGLFFWLSILLAPAALNILVIRSLVNRSTELPIVGLFAVIYSLVAVHFEDYVYTIYGSAVVFLALLLTIKRVGIRNLCSLATIGLSTVAIYSHAGQSRERGYTKIATNVRHEFRPAIIPNTSIVVSKKEATKYSRILDVINRCTSHSDTIYAFPMNPELYVLSNRNNAFELIVSFIGINSELEIKSSLEIFNSSDAPALVIHSDNDWANLDITTKIWEKSKHLYLKIGKIENWKIYQHKNQIDKKPCQVISIN